MTILYPPYTPEHTTIPSTTFHTSLDNLVIIPQSIADVLLSFPRETIEYSFIMLYKPRVVNGHELDPSMYEQGQSLRLMPIELLVATGEGGRTEVTHDRRRLNILNQFLTENPWYRYVDVHTHPESLGPYFAENFSGGDLQQCIENASSLPYYLAALVTSTRIKFWPSNVSTTINLMARRDIEQIFPGYISDVAQARYRLTAIAGNRLDINYFLFE